MGSVRVATHGREGGAVSYLWAYPRAAVAMKHRVRQYPRRWVPSDAEARWIRILKLHGRLTDKELVDHYHISKRTLKEIVGCHGQWSHLKRQTLGKIVADRIEAGFRLHEGHVW